MNSGTLKVHVRTHTGQLANPCPLGCVFAARTRKALMAHVRLEHDL